MIFDLAVANQSGRHTFGHPSGLMSCVRVRVPAFERLVHARIVGFALLARSWAELKRWVSAEDFHDDPIGDLIAMRQTRDFERRFRILVGELSSLSWQGGTGVWHAVLWSASQAGGDTKPFALATAPNHEALGLG
jgi:hypothetical protein